MSFISNKSYFKKRKFTQLNFISDVNTWRKHRKIITPTFHFKILNEFFDVFTRNAVILCEQLKSKTGKGPLDIHCWVKLMALDNICG